MFDEEIHEKGISRRVHRGNKNVLYFLPLRNRRAFNEIIPMLPRAASFLLQNYILRTIRMRINWIQTILEGKLKLNKKEIFVDLQ